MKVAVKCPRCKELFQVEVNGRRFRFTNEISEKVNFSHSKGKFGKKTCFKGEALVLASAKASDVFLLKGNELRNAK